MEATITTNVQRLFSHYGIEGVVIFETRPDRVFAWDTLGQLQAWCKTGHWFEDWLDPLHGTLLGNYRERKYRPSCQVCIHPISQINHPKLLDTKFCEIDFDLAAPTNPATLAIHLGEVVVNAVRHITTDQIVVYMGLCLRPDLGSNLA